MSFDPVARGLASRPRYAAGRRLAIIGHSHGRQNHNWTTGIVSNEYRGEITQAQRMMGHTFTCDVIYDAAYTGVPVWNSRGFRGQNCSISGAIGSDLAAQVTAALATRPRAVACMISENDVTALRAPAALRAEIQAAAARIVEGAGRPFIIRAGISRPTSQWASGSDQRKMLRHNNDWLHDTFNGRPGCFVVDPNTVLMDGSNADGVPISGYFAGDNQHLSNIGGYVSAKNVWVPVLKTIFPGAPRYFGWAPDNIYDATLDSAGNVRNPLGNLAPNPNLSGTGGTRGTGTSGPAGIATGWRIDNATAGGVITAVVTMGIDSVLGAAAGYFLHLAFTMPGGGSSSETFTFRPATDFDVSAFPNAWMRAGFYMRRSAGAGLFNRTDVFVKDNGNPSADVMQWYGLRSFDTTLPLVTEAEEGFVVTPPFKLGPTPTTLRLAANIGLYGAMTGSPTADIGMPFCMPIADPNLTLFN